MAKDAEYTELLQATVSGNTSIAQYSEWLRGNYLGAIVRAHDVSQFWCRVIECNLDTRDKAAEDALVEARQAESSDYDY